jgi:transcriptional regulator with XRE-family HTH domain
VAVTVRNPQWFGDVVRQASTLRGFATQADLAAASDLSLNSVVNIVTGARGSYRPGTIDRLAHGLDVQTSRLIALATSTSTRRRDADGAARDLLDAGARTGQARIAIDVEAGDLSVVEAALAAALASLEATQPGLRTHLHRLD